MNNRSHRQLCPSEYSHAPRDFWNRRRELWDVECADCRVPWPCQTYIRDRGRAAADLTRYWRDTGYAHAEALAVKVPAA